MGLVLSRDGARCPRTFSKRGACNAKCQGFLESDPGSLASALDSCSSAEIFSFAGGFAFSDGFGFIAAAALAVRSLKDMSSIL